MTGSVDRRLDELGITLPGAAASVANYVPFARTGNLLMISGQLPLLDGALQGVGKVGRDLDVAAAADIARICGLNVIAQVRDACDGDLDRVVRVVKLGGFVNCTDDFTDHPEVVNGASNLMVDVFGEAGRHSRFAIGVNALPRGVAVEVEAVFELR